VVGREGGQLRYTGPEGDVTVFGPRLQRLDSPLEPDRDAGSVQITLEIPRAFGVSQGSPVTFGTIAITTTGRGFITDPGVEYSYDALPLVGRAMQMELPL
jgi:hypothetical protein